MTMRRNQKRWIEIREKYRQALKRAALLEQNDAASVTLHFSEEAAKIRQKP